MKIKPFLLSLGMLSVLHGVAIHAADVSQHAKIDPYVQKQMQSRTQTKQSVFVVLKDQADLRGADALLSREEKIRYVYEALRNKAIATQGSLIDFLKSKKANFRRFYIENMILVENPSPELIKSLAARADVARIMGNPIVSLKLPADKSTVANRSQGAGPEQSLVSLGATTVWEKYHVRGEGIVIAGQDTGVQWNHPALIRQYRGSSKDGSVTHDYNWHDAIHGSLGQGRAASRCSYDTQVPCDDQGHGTHTIGTIVGDDQKGNQIGVAPNAKWIACKNMDNGVGTPATYIECFEFLLAPYPLRGHPFTDGDPSKAPHIINNSWGCTADEGCVGNEILPSLKAMNKAGILVVASAGNEGPGCSSMESPPAWHTGLTFAIGAYNHRSGNIAAFSSRGPSVIDGGVGPNLAAPGVSIRSAVPGGQYESMSGTSMAGPHAVGAAALLWSFKPSLMNDIKQTISIFESTSTAKTSHENCGNTPGTHIPNNTYGYGLMNVAKAVQTVA